MSLEFPHPDLEEIFSGRIDDLQGNDPQFDVPLEPKEKSDPFYQAQVLQQGLREAVPISNQPVRDVMGVYARNVLNTHYAREIRNRRLAFTTFLFSAINSEDKTSDSYEGRAIVTGVFEGFNLAALNGDDTIVAQLTEPRFIDPKLIKKDNIKHIFIPVLGLSEWAIDPRAA